MSSDAIKPRGDVKFKAAGIGMHMRFRCAKCDKPASQLGCGIRLWCGVKQRMCGPCKTLIDKRRARDAE
jgi:hypothetical protein